MHNMMIVNPIALMMIMIMATGSIAHVETLDSINLTIIVETTDNIDQMITIAIATMMIAI